MGRGGDRSPSLNLSLLLALNSLSELPLVGPLSGAKQTPPWQPPEIGFDPFRSFARIVVHRNFYQAGPELLCRMTLYKCWRKSIMAALTSEARSC
jgi:hypothetical protein